MRAYRVTYTGHRDRNDTATRTIIRYTFTEPKLCIITGMINPSFIIDSIEVKPIGLVESIDIIDASGSSDEQ